MSSKTAAHNAREAFNRARRKAFIGQVLAALQGRSNRLLAFHQIHEKARIGGPIYRGIQSVEIAKIVGSVDRYYDFDRAFMPTQTFTRERWWRVGSAFMENIKLPPVQLYKAGDVYFVIDGNHRISVARELGQEYIDAEVLEFRLRVPLTSDMDAEDLALVGTLAEFLTATGLDAMQPDYSFRMTTTEGYSILYDHINVHRYLQSQEWNREFTFEEAAAQWFEQVYRPIVDVIRETGILEDFPGRTEADLYVWLVEHLYYLRERYGNQVDVRRAARGFARHFTRRGLRRAWHYLTHHLLGRHTDIEE